MKISKKQDGSTLVMSVEGRLDTSTAPELDAEINSSLDGIESLELDFTSLDYISSAGLRVLLSAQKKMSKQGSMKVTHVCDAVIDVFEITGFTDIITIE